MQIGHALTTPMLPGDPNLHSIVHELIEETAPLAVHNHNYIINNIPADLFLEASRPIVSSVLDKLFTTALRHTKNSVILITAKVYGMAILVQLKSKGDISPALTEEIGLASLRAQRTGGIIEIINCEKEQALIAYCFLNVCAAA